MKKFFWIFVILIFCGALVFAQDNGCYQQEINGTLMNVCRTDDDEPRPVYVPDIADFYHFCIPYSDGSGEDCENIYTWPVVFSSPISPIFASPVAPLAEKEKKDTVEQIPQSGYVNGVFVPVYGLPCDQVYSDGLSNCMCFYEHEKWCN